MLSINSPSDSLLPPSPRQSDSVLPECSTTLKRLERPSVRPLRTGLSLVVVERAQAEPPPPPMVRCWRLHRLRSLEEEVPSSLDVEPKNRTVGYLILPNNDAYIEDLWTMLTITDSWHVLWLKPLKLQRRWKTSCDYLQTLGVAVWVIHTWASSTASRCGCELYPARSISAGFVPTPARRWLLTKGEETRLWSVTPTPCCWEGCLFEARCWRTVKRSAWTWWTCRPPGRRNGSDGEC